MQPLTENQEKWLQALESGKYSQCSNYLHRQNDGYCCLGVACDIHDPTKWSCDSPESLEAMTYDCDGNSGLSAALTGNFRFHSSLGEIKQGCRDTFYQFLKEAGFEGCEQLSLAHYNDTGATFAQLATVIRKYPEAVFVPV